MTTPETPSPANSRKRIAGRFALLVLLPAAIVTSCSFLARWHWTLDLACHFPLQLSVGAMFALILLCYCRRWKWAGVALLVLAVQVPRLAPFYTTRGEQPLDAPRFRAISANVLRANTRRGPFLEFIRAERPDFFVALELDSAWTTALLELQEAYPHRIVEPREGNFGIGLFSRLPITSHQIVPFADGRAPLIVATIELGDRPLTVIAAHPPPPMGGAIAQVRNQQLQELGRIAAQSPRPLIVLGDLNITPWSPHFQDLLESSRLRDSRLGWGIQPTWPANPWLLRIPIDHALVSRDVRVIARRTGPSIYSDHRPIVLDFQHGETGPEAISRAN